MHDTLFAKQDEWSGQSDPVPAFKQLAGGLGVDQAQFDACLDGGKYADKVNADAQEGMAAGAQGTPYFLINDIPLSGAQPFSAFQTQIDYVLAGGEPPTMEVAADSFRSRGQAEASVVVTEFSDFQ